MKRWLAVLLILACLACAGVGAWFQFFRTAGYKETTAVITRIETIEHHGASKQKHRNSSVAYVRYEVNGRKYEGPSDIWESNYQEGMQIKVYYDPEDPSKLAGDPGILGIFFMGMGGAGLFIVILMTIFDKGQVNR